MLKFKHTGLEEFSFGEDRDENYYILINRKISPEGLNLDKLRLADPRKFDQVLDDMGCIVMLDGTEVDELLQRGELNKQNLHKSLYELAKKEGLIRA